MLSSPAIRPSLQKRLRPVLLGGTLLLVVLKIVALSPAPLEDSSASPRAIDLDELVLKEQNTLAPGIPKGTVPDYTIDQFNYVSTHAGEKQWNLLAQQAFFFNADKLVHARIVKALLYDTEGKITVVTGLESKYLMTQNDLEIFGDVQTRFPDGFLVKSDYMRYLTKKHRVEIPVSYPTEGDGVEQGGQKIHFDSHGLVYEMDKGEIYLSQDVKFKVLENQTTTLLVSDHALIHRDRSIVDFMMAPQRPDKTRFVQIYQPTLYARGRTGKLKYGSGVNLLQDMTLFDDVFVEEFTDKDGVRSISRYGTGGQGDFDSRHNTVVLTIYPQVYQDEDTLTGDKITLHRESDIIEVEHSNGFSTGNDDDADSSP